MRPLSLQICLDINNAPLQALEDAGDRMGHFLRQLPEIPLAILFARGGRLVQPGFRWAPRSLTAPAGVILNAPDGAGTLDPKIPGLLCDFPSFLLSSRPQPS